MKLITITLAALAVLGGCANRPPLPEELALAEATRQGLRIGCAAPNVARVGVIARDFKYDHQTGRKYMSYFETVRVFGPPVYNSRREMYQAAGLIGDQACQDSTPIPVWRRKLTDEQRVARGFPEFAE